MIVFYTSISVIDSFDIPSLLNHSFECVTGMRHVPGLFKNMVWDGSESGEWKLERNIMSYEIDVAAKVASFRISTVDDNDELWTIDLVLKENEHNLQARLTRERRIVSAEYDSNFHVPYVFKKLMRDGKGGIDVDIPITDRPIFLDKNNLTLMEKIILGEKKYELPIIFVSHPFNKSNYAIDVIKLSQELAGSAHVIVEESAFTSAILKQRTNGKNAYDGAVDVFYNDDSLRYLSTNSITASNFRYKIRRAVYSRMALRNIDDEYSLNSIRLRNRIRKLNATNIATKKLELEIEMLNEKNKEYAQYIEMMEDELKAIEKKANQLENEKYVLSAKNENIEVALKRKEANSVSSISLEYTEEQFYEDEIKRFVLETIKNTISGYGKEEKERRDYHILIDIVDHNTVSDTGDKLKESIRNILENNNLSKAEGNGLVKLGFELIKGGHNKYKFHNDDRYIVTVSKSPSDHRGGKNTAHDAGKLIFGRT